MASSTKTWATRFEGPPKTPAVAMREKMADADKKAGPTQRVTFRGGEYVTKNRPLREAVKEAAKAKETGMAGTADNGSGGKQGGVRSPKQKEKAGKTQPHIVEEQMGGGKIRVHSFASKAEAHTAGMEMRRGGKDVAVHAADSKWSQSAQLKAQGKGDHVEHASGAGGDQKRDDQGRFA